MIIMEIVKILEMKQICLQEDTIFLNENLAEDKANNERLKILTTQIDQFDEVLTKINTEHNRIDNELKTTIETNILQLDNEFKTLLEQEPKTEVHDIQNRFF